MEVESLDPFAFFQLPLQVQYEYMLAMDLPSLRNVCATARLSKHPNAVEFYKEICNKKGFWVEKFRRDFPSAFSERTIDLPLPWWRDAYLRALQEEFIRSVLDGNVATVKRTLDLGADVNVRAFDDHGTALHVAVESGMRTMIPILLDAGADIDAQDDADWTPLQIAVAEGHFDVLQTFIDRGANVDMPDHTGQTPLHHAAEFGHLASVHILLDSGANLNARDRNGWTPVMLAIFMGEEEAEDMLLEAGAEFTDVDAAAVPF